MAPTIEAQVAAQGARIAALEKAHDELREGLAASIERIDRKLDKLLFGTLGVLATALTGLIVALVRHG